jgi:hypothetical protein
MARSGPKRQNRSAANFADQQPSGRSSLQSIAHIERRFLVEQRGNVAKSKRERHFFELSLEDRLLIYAVDRDRSRGRGEPARTVQTDATDTVFIFSSAYLHWRFEVFANIVAWSELRQYAPAPSYGGPALPTGFIAMASIPQGMMQSYNFILRRLVKNGTIYGFEGSFRALAGLGGKLVPMLQLWTQAGGAGTGDILAISLTEKGFERAAKISDSFRGVRTWQLHEFIVQVPGFLDKMRGES